MYLLVYGGDVDGIVDGGIPEYETPNTGFEIVSTAPVLFTPLMLTT